MTAWPGAGNPNGVADVERHRPEKECPFCGERVGSLPDHILKEHDAE